MYISTHSLTLFTNCSPISYYSPTLSDNVWLVTSKKCLRVIIFFSRLRVEKCTALYLLRFDTNRVSFMAPPKLYTLILFNPKMYELRKTCVTLVCGCHLDEGSWAQTTSFFFILLISIPVLILVLWHLLILLKRLKVTDRLICRDCPSHISSDWTNLNRFDAALRRDY